MNQDIVDSLNVFCSLRGTRHFVGRLAERNRAILFEYDKDFLNSGIELSPFKLPLQSGIFEDKERVFDGLPGVFNDSLPDGLGGVDFSPWLIKFHTREEGAGGRD